MAGSPGGSGGDTRYLTRRVGFRLDRRLHGFACGEIVCDGRRFLGRQVGYKEGIKRYGVSSECYKEVGVEFIIDCRGNKVSTKLMVELIIQTPSSCFDENLCPKGIVEYDEDTGLWVGTVTIGSHATGISIECIPESSSVGYHYLLRISDICRGPASSEAVIPLLSLCQAPFRAGGEAPAVVPVNCCANASSTTVLITAKVTGLQRPRYLGRFLKYRNGIKVYGVAECCPGPEPCQSYIPCCNCLVMPWQYTFTVAGFVNKTPPICFDCPNYNGTWTITRQGSDSCTWVATGPPIPCTPAPPWTLVCFSGLGKWQLASSSFGGAAVFEKSIATWDCLGPNTLTKTVDHGGCDGTPGSITINPV